MTDHRPSPLYLEAVQALRDLVEAEGYTAARIAAAEAIEDHFTRKLGLQRPEQEGPK